jgi:signal transduction histidine kinase
VTDTASGRPLATAQLDSEDLGLLAARGHAAIGGEAVLITGRDARGRTTIVGSAGLSPEDLLAAWPTVVACDLEEGPAAPGGIPVLVTARPSPLPSGRELLRLVMFVAGSRMGVFHVVVGPDAPPVDHQAAAQYARHAAVSVARRRLRRGSSAHLERRIARADAILDFTAAVSSVGFESLIGRIDAAARSVFGPSVRARVYTYDDDRGALEALPEPGHGDLGAIATDDPGSAIARVFTLERSYMTNAPAGEAPRGLPSSWSPRPTSALLVPLFVSGRASGVLQLVDKPGGFAMTDLHDAELLSRPIAVAVELTATLRRLRIQSEIEAVLSNTTALLRPVADTRQVLPDVLAAMRDATAATVVMFAARGTPLLAAASGATPPAQEELVGRLTSRLRRDPIELSGVAHCRSLLIAPVRIGPEQVATLAAIAAPGAVFGAVEQRGMARLANVIALAIAAVRDLAHRTALARLQERQRMADELHDEVAQLLFAAQVQLDELIDVQGLDETVLDLAVGANALVLRSDATLRRVITELPRRSPALLAERLVTVVDETRRAFRAEIESVVSDAALDTALDVAPELHDLLVNVARESLVNAAKHAGPCLIQLALHLAGPDTLRLTVCDDGVGLDSRPPSDRPGGHGLAALRRQVATAGGTMTVAPRRVGVRWPPPRSTSERRRPVTPRPRCAARHRPPARRPCRRRACRARPAARASAPRCGPAGRASA